MKIGIVGAGNIGANAAKLFVEAGRYMADDWTIIGSDGSVGDKATFLALVKSGTLTHDVMEPEDLHIRVYGETAVVTARGVSGGKYQGQPFREVEQSSCSLRRTSRAVEVCLNTPLAARPGRSTLTRPSSAGTM